MAKIKMPEVPYTDAELAKSCIQQFKSAWVPMKLWEENLRDEEAFRGYIRVKKIDTWQHFQRRIKEAWLDGGKAPFANTAFTWQTWLIVDGGGMLERYHVNQDSWNKTIELIAALSLIEADFFLSTVVTPGSGRSRPRDHRAALLRGEHCPESDELSADHPPAYRPSAAFRSLPSYEDVEREDRLAEEEREDDRIGLSSGVDVRAEAEQEVEQMGKKDRTWGWRQRLMRHLQDDRLARGMPYVGVGLMAPIL